MRIPRKIEHVQGYMNGFLAAQRLMRESGDLTGHSEEVRAIARTLQKVPEVQKRTVAKEPRKHRLELQYPALWKAIDGAIRAAQAAHPDIEISAKRRSSIVKRCVGQVLASARSEKSDETGPR